MGVLIDFIRHIGKASLAQIHNTVLIQSII